MMKLLITTVYNLKEAALSSVILDPSMICTLLRCVYSFLNQWFESVASSTKGWLERRRLMDPH